LSNQIYYKISTSQKGKNVGYFFDFSIHHEFFKLLRLFHPSSSTVASAIACLAFQLGSFRSARWTEFNPACAVALLAEIVGCESHFLL
jgi:hypothetical protein